MDPSLSFMCCMGLLSMAVLANIEKKFEACLVIQMLVCLILLFST